MRADVPDTYGYLRVYEKDNVKLACHVTPTNTTTVRWHHRDHVDYGAPLEYDIYIDGQIYDRLKRRFSIYDQSAGDYSLTIVNILPDDAGRYRCFNQEQLLKTYVIYVDCEY